MLILVVWKFLVIYGISYHVILPYKSERYFKNSYIKDGLARFGTGFEKYSTRVQWLNWFRSTLYLSGFQKSMLLTETHHDFPSG